MVPYILFAFGIRYKAIIYRIKKAANRKIFIGNYIGEQKFILTNQILGNGKFRQFPQAVLKRNGYG